MSVSVEVPELTHARMEPAIVGCPGLFTARDRRGRGLRIDQQIGDVELMWRSVDRLTPGDLMTLAALVAIAGPGGRAAEPAHDHGLISALDMRANDEPASLSGTLVVETVMARVLRECGREDAGRNRVALCDSLRRLASLTVIVRSGKREVGMHLLSYAVDEDSRALRVALSPRLTAALLGGRYTRIDLREMRALGEHARLLYVRLCVWIDPGVIRRIGLEVLMGYLWPEPPAGAVMVRDRRRLTQRAMRQLSELPGWRSWIDERGVQYTIGRPPVKTPTPPVKTPTPPVKTPTPPGVFSE